MTPDFHELVGDETTSEDELRALRDVHDLLVSASPPVALGRRRPSAPRVRPPIRRSWAIGGLGLAAALSAALGLAAGLVFGHDPGFRAASTRPMHGMAGAAAARALIEVGKADGSGNRSLRVSVHALPAIAGDGWYELDLTKNGKPVISCGVFRTGRDGSALVRMNAPADLAEYDGWIVTAVSPGRQPRVLLTT